MWLTECDFVIREYGYIFFHDNLFLGKYEFLMIAEGVVWK